MDLNETAVSSLDGLINQVHHRMVLILKNSNNRTYLKWPDCGAGFYWNVKRSACLKDIVSSGSGILSATSPDGSGGDGTLLISHQERTGHELSQHTSLAVYAPYFYPLAVVFIIISMAAVLVVMRFYVEFLIYKFTRSETRRVHDLRSVGTLRSEFSDSLESLPPPYPGGLDDGNSISVNCASGSSSTSLEASTQIATITTSSNMSSAIKISHASRRRDPPPSYDQSQRSAARIAARSTSTSSSL